MQEHTSHVLHACAGFLRPSGSIRGCHCLSRSAPPENVAGIRMGGRWVAGPGKDQCNLQSAFHTISVLDGFQQPGREIHSAG